MQGNSKKTRARILVAGPLGLFKLVTSVLRVNAEILFAHTMEQAMLHLKAGACLVVCGEGFDESRMFNFLHLLAARPATRRIPVICCRDGEMPLSISAYHTIDLALDALGVRHFLDMARLRADYGIEAAHEVLHALILEQLRIGYRAFYKDKAPE